jgi:hypothetical protein
MAVFLQHRASEFGINWQMYFKHVVSGKFEEYLVKKEQTAFDVSHVFG